MRRPPSFTPGVEGLGILDSRWLPDDDFSELWEAIVIDDGVKARLRAQAVLNFTARDKVNRAHLPLHGLMLLHGPPGTGKTSLARALASRTAEAVTGIGEFLFIEVEPHALAGAMLGKSQKAVRDLLGQTIAEHAAQQPTIVLLDEVETLAADRAKLSLEANPVDVHRATDAVLAQLDHLASSHPHLLFIATSNFTRAVDQALLSRADLVTYIGPPNADACLQILQSALGSFAKSFPGGPNLAHDARLKKLAAKCEGLDGRQVRKLVLSACAFDLQVAQRPEKLGLEHLERAITEAQRERAGLAEGSR
jgi:SpoVK/Ycf46/Vps4 family AAA+-type ATPase